jgi:hypothetical protein
MDFYTSKNTAQRGPTVATQIATRGTGSTEKSDWHALRAHVVIKRSILILAWFSCASTREIALRLVIAKDTKKAQADSGRDAIVLSTFTFLTKSSIFEMARHQDCTRRSLECLSSRVP